MIEGHEVAEMRAQGDLTAYRKAVGLAARSVCGERRTAILAHSDLALMLLEAPLKMSSPEKWTGFVPPLTYEGKQRRQRNDSPYRAQLVAILRQAEQRDGRNYGLGVTGE